MYALANSESQSATQKVALRDYYTELPWYQLAYGVDMNAVLSDAIRRFYLKPWRILSNVRRTNPASLVRGGLRLIKMSARTLTPSKSTVTVLRTS